MRKKHIKMLLFACLLFMGQTAWADGVHHIAFYEAFDTNEGSGGRDGQFGGNGIATSNPHFDTDGWSYNQYIKGASECIRFGTTEDGVLTTPEIVLLGKQATLTFYAASWAGGNNNRLVITANEGVTLNDQTTIMLGNSSTGPFHYYEVTIELTTATYVQLTFTGKRGFLDDVMVEETVTAINAPTLPDEHLFWANTTEDATTNVTLVPSDSTTVYYTTDGSDPTPDNGHIATLTTNFQITGTTTVKARAYYQTIASELVSRTYTEGESVSTIAEFNARDEGDEVRLFIPYDSQARLLHQEYGNAYIHDNTAPLCLKFEHIESFNPTPKDNQHVAGWIIGKKHMEDGMPTLVVTSNTNTNYLALADRVSEENISPIEIDINTNLSDYIGKWVKCKEVRNNTDFHLNIGWSEAFADVSGIVTDNQTITPMKILDNPGLIFILDENMELPARSEDYHADAIRLKRALKAEQWNTFCVPFDIEDLEDCEIREFDDIDGTTMKFKEANYIQKGVPYLVKPLYDDIVDPVFQNQTLSAQSAMTITHGDYSFIGTYSPKELATDKTELFLTNSGNLAYPSSDATATIKGMRAYFKVPAGADARLSIDGVDTSLNIEHGTLNIENCTVYDLQGRKLSVPSSQFSPGIYISNGKKIVIK